MPKTIIATICLVLPVVGASADDTPGERDRFGTVAGGPSTAPAENTAATQSAARPATRPSGPEPTTYPVEQAGATPPAAHGTAATTRRSLGSSLRGDGEAGGLATRDGLETTDLLVEMLASVLVILLLGGIALVVTRRVLPRFKKPRAGNMSVLETVHLGPRKSMHLVQVGSRRLLVGSTRDQVSMLAEVSDAWQVDAPAEIDEGAGE